jgi:hypothetical protein
MLTDADARLDAYDVTDSLMQLTWKMDPETAACTLGLLVYAMTATWRANAIRSQATTGNVTSLWAATAREVVPTAAGVEELLAAIGAEARTIRAECAEMNGED